MATYKIELNKDQSELLSRLPEQGMGYQIVNVFLKDGKVLKHRVVLNCSFLQLEDNEQLKTEDIDKIELHNE